MVATDGNINGKTILLNITNSLHPSILAASISESLMAPSVYPLMKNTDAGVTIAFIRIVNQISIISFVSF